MNVRITRELENDATILHIDGDLRSEDVSTLNSESRKLTGQVILELSQLQSADTSGVSALLEIASTGVEFRGTSGYLKMLLAKNS